jgi:hypothetical protein
LIQTQNRRRVIRRFAQIFPAGKTQIPLRYIRAGSAATSFLPFGSADILVRD